MRIATWNVNSLKVRLQRLEEWIARARPDVLLLQETKLADETAPRPLCPKNSGRHARCCPLRRSAGSLHG